MNIVAYIVAALIFGAVALDWTPGDSDRLDVLAVGLLVFAVAHVLPNGLAVPRRG